MKKRNKVISLAAAALASVALANANMSNEVKAADVSTSVTNLGGDKDTANSNNDAVKGVEATSDSAQTATDDNENEAITTKSTDDGSQNEANTTSESTQKNQNDEKDATSESILNKYNKVIQDAEDNDDWNDGFPSAEEQAAVSNDKDNSIEIKDIDEEDIQGPTPIENNVIHSKGKDYTYTAKGGTSTIFGTIDGDGYTDIYMYPNDEDYSENKEKYDSWQKLNNNIIVKRESTWDMTYGPGDAFSVSIDKNSDSTQVIKENDDDDNNNDDEIDRESTIDVTEYAVVTPEGNIVHKVEFTNVGDDENDVMPRKYFLLLDTSLNGKDGTPIYSNGKGGLFITNGNMVYSVRPLNDTKLYATNYPEAASDDADNPSEIDVPASTDNDDKPILSDVDDTAIRITTPSVALDEGDSVDLWYMETAYPVQGNDISEIGKEAADKLDSSADPVKKAIKVSRTIHITYPDGTTQDVRQEVTLSRMEKVNSDKTTTVTDWKAESGEKAEFEEYIPKSIDGYELLVNDKSASKVDSAAITIDGEGKDAKPQNGEEVYVTYRAIPQDETTTDSATPIATAPITNTQTVTVNRTIHITNPDGTTEDKIQTVTLSRTVTTNGNQQTATAWQPESAKFEAYTPRVNDGYDTLVDGQKSSQVPEASVVIAGNGINAEPQNGSEVYVTYEKQSEDVVHSDVDSKSDKSTTSDSNSEPSETKVQKSDEKSISIAKNKKRSEVNSNRKATEYRKLSKKSNKVNKLTKKLNTYKVVNTTNELPKTGEKSADYGIFGAILTSLAGLLGLAGAEKKRKRD